MLHFRLLMEINPLLKMSEKRQKRRICPILPEADPGRLQTSKMESFATINNS